MRRNPDLGRLVMPEPDRARAEGCAILRVPGLGGLHILHATRSDAAAGVATRQEHRHDIWHCIAYAAGDATCLVDGAEMSVRSPCLVLTSPGQPHSFSRLTGERATYHEITFAPDRPGAICDWSGLLSAWSGLPCRIPASLPCAPACVDDVGSIAGRITATIRADLPETPVLLQGLLTELLLSLFRHLVAGAERAAPDDPTAIARRFIEANAEDPIDLPAVARAAGLSAKHLGRAFAARYGDPPMRYRRRLLMRRAAVVLRTSDAPVERIAAALGFDDWRYFSRCFRAEHGVAPAAYRRG